MSIQETRSEAAPHSDAAERSVLGAILVDNDQFERAREIVDSECFYSPRNQQIFEALQKLVDNFQFGRIQNLLKDIK